MSSNNSTHDIKIPLGIRMNCRNGLHVLFPPSPEPFHLKITSTQNYITIFDETIPGNGTRPREFKSMQTFSVPWEVTITRQDGHTLFHHVISLSGRPVCVRLDSEQLSDLIPWAATCEDFQHQTNCRLTVLLHENFAALLSQGYPKLHFITEDAFDESDYLAVFAVGHSADANESPKPYAQSHPLQNIASILGVTPPYSQPRLAQPQLPPAAEAAKERTICFMTERKSSAWENALSKTAKTLRQRGYTVLRTPLQGGDLLKCAAAVASSSLVLTDTLNGS